MSEQHCYSISLTVMSLMLLMLLQTVEGYTSFQRNLHCTSKKDSVFTQSNKRYIKNGKGDHFCISLTRIAANDKITETSSETISISTAMVETESSTLQPWQGFLILNTIAVLWGSQHVVIKSSLDILPSASLLNAWRFALSTLLFLPSLISATKKQSTAFPAGIELGLYTFLGFGFQAIGLETTTASRSAFLLYLNVKIVPFLAAVFFKRKIAATTWLSAFFALSGTVLLSSDGGGINQGDLWCICAAVASAMFILRLETFARKYDAGELNSISFATVAMLCAGWVVGDIQSGHLPILSTYSAAAGIDENVSSLSDNLHALMDTIIAPVQAAPWSLLYLGIITTAVCNFLQTIGQRSVSAEKAAIIYSMDPVYGALFSYYFLHEEFGLRSFAGAALIILGIVVSNTSGSSKEDSNNSGVDQSI